MRELHGQRHWGPPKEITRKERNAGEEDHDYVHHYLIYWSDESKCHTRIYREDGHHPLVICSQLPNNGNKSMTNMAEYLTAEMSEEHGLPMPVVSIEHYPEHERGIGGYSLASFASWG